MENRNGGDGFYHSSRKSWALLRRLGAAQPIRKEGEVSANDVASILFKTSNIKPSKHEKIEIKKKFATALGECVEKSTCMEDFSEGEVTDAMKLVKKNKVAGVDGILPEFIKNLGPKGRRWLSKFFSYIKNSNTLTKL